MTWDFWADNKDVITTILAVLSALGTLGGGIWAVLRNRRIRVDVKVFEVISDPGVLLPKLYATENDDSPLADHNIKYQPRDPKRDLQAELKAALNRSHYLLVTAPTGYGKTREAGMLAQTMMLEGWRVLRIRTGWLDLPKSLPEELGSNRSRILLFLDDLNGLFSTGNLTQSPRIESEKSLMLSQMSYHDRLLQVLDMFEEMCTESEIRVIATARSEAEQWEKLEFNEKDRLWKRFERIEIPAPINSTVVKLLEDMGQELGLQAKKDDLQAIAQKSDGTYRNILLNLRRWRTQSKEISQHDFNETLDGSWREVYERAIKKKPVAKYVYDAIDILQQANIELFPALIIPVAVKIWGSRNFAQDYIHEKRVIEAGKFLVSEARIFHQKEGKLVPRDGQIESKGIAISWEIYTEFLTSLLLQKERGKHVSVSLMGLAQSCLLLGKVQYSVSLVRKYISLNPLSSDGYALLGETFSEENIKKYGNLQKTDVKEFLQLGEILSREQVKKYKESESAYRKALELDPYNIYTYTRLGYLLAQLNRNDEAESLFRKAIEIAPSYIESYRGLGRVLAKIKRYDEAEVTYLRALEVNMDARVVGDFSYMLESLKRYDEAEVYYRKAIEFDASYYFNATSLSRVLQGFKRYNEAEEVLRVAILTNPKKSYICLRLGEFLKSAKRPEEAESMYRKAIKLEPDEFAYNKLGQLLESLSRYDEAEAAYRKAIEIAPLETDAYGDLVNLFFRLKKYSDARITIQKAMEIRGLGVNEDILWNVDNEVMEKGLLDLIACSLETHNFAEIKMFFRENAIFRMDKFITEEEFAETTKIAEETVAVIETIESNPLNVEAYKKLGNIFDGSESVYRKIVEIVPEDFNTHYELGDFLKDAGKYEESEKEFCKSIEINPANFQPYIGLGGLLAKLKRYDEAEVAFRKAMEIAPLSPEAHTSLGHFFYLLGKFEQAETYCRKAVELSPSNIIFQNRLGLTLQKLERYSEAESVFNAAIQINPSHTSTYKNLAYLLYVTQRIQEELLVWENLSEITPKDHVPYLVICSINKQLGNLISLDYITKARYLMPHAKWYDIACLESICGKFDSAFTYLKLAVQENGFSSSHAWKDRDLQWLWDDPRFAEIVGAKPD